VGFESFSRFSNEYGDFLTADIQMRLSYNDLNDSSDAWALEIHNAWFDYKLGLGRKVRMGHFPPAFGLEPEVDTHSSLFQTLATRDIGFKKDWGVLYSGTAPGYDYQAAVTIGSGMGIERQDGSGIATVKIGSPGGGNVRYGISALYGEVLITEESGTIPRPEYADDPVLKERIGADAQILSGPLDISLEASVGRNDGNDAGGALIEVGYNVYQVDNLQLISQCRYWSEENDAVTDRWTTGGVGFQWILSESTRISAAFFYDLDAPDGQEDQQAMVQFYYLGS
jgi:hypothetical protein